MKIANFTDTYLPHHNGVATSLYAVHHAEKPWDNYLFGPIDHPDVINVSGMPFPLFPEYEIAYNNGELMDKVRDFDVIHVHTPYGMFYYALKASEELKKPLIGTFHTDPAAVFGALIPVDSKLGGPATWVTWRYLVKLYNQCDVVVAVSKWLEVELQKQGLKAPIRCVQNGIDVHKFRPDVDTKQFKDKFDLHGKPLVLFMGRLQHKKDPETFVRAALESKSDAIFLISGKGELEPKLRELAAGHPNIIITGFLPLDMAPQAYAAADVFVMPSEMETQGLVILEALAAGTPCIATDVGVTREVTSPEYIMGMRDYKGLAKMIDKLLGDKKERERLGKEGRKLMEKEFSIEAMVRKLGALYEEVSRK